MSEIRRIGLDGTHWPMQQTSVRHAGEIKTIVLHDDLRPVSNATRNKIDGILEEDKKNPEV